MSRSNYSDDMDDPLAYGRWRQAVKRAIEGKRGQVFLNELLKALDEMPDKKLYSGNFVTVDGEFCTLGVLAAKRGTRVDDLNNEDDCDQKLVGERFGIAYSMASEIMFMNDEHMDDWKWVNGRRVKNDNHAQDRWQMMRDWVASKLN
jgi:hypothetical protein